MSINGEERSKIRGWADSVIREIKEAFGIRSPSAVMRDEVGKNIALGVANGIYENDKEVVKQFKLMLDKLKYMRDTDVISEDEYYRGLERLRDSYFSVGTQQWQKYTAEIYRHQREVLEEERAEIEQMYNDVSAYAVRRMDEVIAKQQSYSDELKRTGELFDVNTATINGVKYSYYSMHDLDADIEKLKEYGNLLAEIRRRGEGLGLENSETEEFLAEIRDLDTDEASEFMRLLLRSDDAGFTSYIKLWNEKNATAEAVSAREYKSEFDGAVSDAYSNMCEKLKAAGYEIPEDFYVSGSISAQNFGEAFTEELDNQLEAIRMKIAEFSEKLSLSADLGTAGGVVYNNETSYNISAADAGDTVEQIRRYETVKRLSGIG